MQRDWTGGVARSAGVVGDESRLMASEPPMNADNYKNKKRQD
jgi:hypothetical protein